jgi:hypothetical protein
MKRSRKQMSAAERVFKDRFCEEVLAKRPILVMPERRHGVVDAHHTISQSWIKARHGSLEPELLWELLWDPDAGVPVDRFRHEQITNAFKRVQPDELRPENVKYAERNGFLHRLAIEVPGFELVEHV